MSCQQVPRLNEDPYTFTEPPAVTTTTFISSPQVQKLTPIKPLNKIQIPSIKRTNGCGTLVNGLTAINHIPIYAKGNPTHQQLQRQRQQQQQLAKQQQQQQHQQTTTPQLNQKQNRLLKQQQQQHQQQYQKQQQQQVIGNQVHIQQLSHQETTHSTVILNPQQKHSRPDAQQQTILQCHRQQQQKPTAITIAQNSQQSPLLSSATTASAASLLTVATQQQQQQRTPFLLSDQQSTLNKIQKRQFLFPPPAPAQKLATQQITTTSAAEATAATTTLPKTTSTISLPPPPRPAPLPPPLPPLYQRTPGIVDSVFIHTTTTTSTPPPPTSIKNHSIVTKVNATQPATHHIQNGSPAAGTGIGLKQQQQYHHRRNVPLTMATIQQSTLNADTLSPLNNDMDQLTSGVICSKVDRSPIDGSSNSNGSSSGVSSAGGSIIGCTTRKLNLTIDNNNGGDIGSSSNTFVRPNVEAKLFVASKKQSGKSQVVNKMKRSYSQSSHHEALQRISMSTSSFRATAGNGNGIQRSTNEWHAPDSYIFDYGLPCPPQTLPTPSLFSSSSSSLSVRFDHQYPLAHQQQQQQQQQHHQHSQNLSNQLHAKSSSLDSYYYESVPVAQNVWYRNLSTFLTRDQQLEIKRNDLRRQAYQYSQAQNFRSTKMARKRLMLAYRALNKLNANSISPAPKICGIPTCSNEALALTAYCFQHITLNTDQKLFHPCTAKFSDNSQCRVPVFDISHELPLCREHAWKRDNYNRMVQEQKPKKPTRKKSKSSALTRPPKRNKKKKKPPSRSPSSSSSLLLYGNNLSLVSMSTALATTATTTATTTTPPPSLIDDLNGSYESTILSSINDSNDNGIEFNSPNSLGQIQRSGQIMFGHNPNINDGIYHIGNGICGKRRIGGGITTIQSHIKHKPNEIRLSLASTPDMFSVCENSSAYESSEDTGVGGLSESELMGATDEIPLMEEHDLTNVLNQLPEDAFNELFTVQQNVPYEPTQEEQEDLELALEAVDEEVKSLEQITGSTSFLSDFLDVDDEILDDSNMCTEIELHSSPTAPSSASSSSSSTSEVVRNIRSSLIHT